MAKTKVVGADLFSQQAHKRREEQEAIEQSIVHDEPVKTESRRGRPAGQSSEHTITVTVRMTAARRQKLKQYAVMHDRTISDVLAEFVDSL